jgi:hypothetical protein
MDLYVEHTCAGVDNMLLVLNSHFLFSTDSRCGRVCLHIVSRDFNGVYLFTDLVIHSSYTALGIAARASHGDGRQGSTVCHQYIPRRRET